MPNRQLSTEELYQVCDLDDLRFKLSSELETLDFPLGQRRAREAIEFGVDIPREGFNVFALGPPGLGKRELLKSVIAHREVDDKPRYDWCYVANFEDPQKPNLLQLEAGTGRELSKDMLQLVEDLLTALPSSFQDEEYQRRRQEIEEDINARYEEAFSKLGAAARERNVTLLRTPAGYTLAPMHNGEIVTPEEFAKLSKEEQKQVQAVIEELQASLQEVVAQLPMLKREAAHRIKSLHKEITEFTVEQFVAWLENKYLSHPQILEYLSAVKQHAIENAEDFLPADGSTEVEHLRERARGYSTLKVNVIVDNTDASGEPLVFEENPTYQNLVGRVEYISQMGTLLTDFTLIKAGSLHRANGGYLVIEADKLLRHVYAWEGLKQALISGEIKIVSLQEMLSLNSTISLEPESAPLDVKVILLGEPLLYHLLNYYDPDFGKIFRVAADFAPDTARTPEQQQLYARLIATMQARDALLPLTRDAVQRVIEHAARLAEDSEKLSLNLERLKQLLEEADYWARTAGATEVRLQDVRDAIAREQDRHSQLRERMGEQILRGIKLIDTSGSKVAQVNGLSVLQLGATSFGLPSRITATARLGTEGVIDIEREAKLGGEIHSKGVMILGAYLAQQYARELPLALSASLVFEQSYGGVDGDSASCAELCVLLSAIAGIPLRQELALTGSMNQLGEAQAIGGVNEKIEGFFDICRERGLDGRQGVIIPAANRPHLMLRDDVREACTEGKFSIHTVDHVEDAMSLLSELPAGTADAEGVYPEGSFNRLVSDRIVELQELRRGFQQRNDDQEES